MRDSHDNIPISDIPARLIELAAEQTRLAARLLTAPTQASESSGLVDADAIGSLLKLKRERVIALARFQRQESVSLGCLTLRR